MTVNLYHEDFVSHRVRELISGRSRYVDLIRRGNAEHTVREILGALVETLIGEDVAAVLPQGERAMQSTLRGLAASNCAA